MEGKKMTVISMQLLNKTFYYESKGKRKLWGKIIDYKSKEDKFFIFNKSNPDGFRIYTHTSEELRTFIDKELITL